MNLKDRMKSDSKPTESIPASQNTIQKSNQPSPELIMQKQSETIKMLQTELEEMTADSKKKIHTLSSEQANLIEEIKNLNRQNQKQSETIVSLNGQIEMMSESDNVYKQNKSLEKKLNEQQEKLKNEKKLLKEKEAELEVRAGNVSAKEYKTEQMYSYVQDLQDNQEAYINEMASNMISDEKAALHASYEQKNKDLINAVKSDKQKLEKQYQKLSADLQNKYKKLSLTNEGIMINICICMALICIFSLSMNTHFIDAYQDILNGFQDFGDDYENLICSIMFVIWLLFLIFWSSSKFGDRYTLYVITILLSLMVFSSGFCYEHNINYIGIGNLLYFIYGVARSIHAIEDYEQRKQATTFTILMIVSIATVIILFKALAASFADLTG